MVALRELGNIRRGHISTTRSSNLADPSSVRALQMGDLPQDGSIPWAPLRRVQPAGSWKTSVIQDGDVVLPLRSTRVSAVVARGVLPRTVAVGHWAIITAGPTVLPEYLAWYLAHPTMARQWRQAEVGSKLAFVPLAAVREMQVEVPPLDVQQRIVTVHALHKRLTGLEQQLQDARNEYVHAVTEAALDRAIHLSN